MKYILLIALMLSTSACASLGRGLSAFGGGMSKSQSKTSYEPQSVSYNGKSMNCYTYGSQTQCY